MSRQALRAGEIGLSLVDTITSADPGISGPIGSPIALHLVEKRRQAFPLCLIQRDLRVSHFGDMGEALQVSVRVGLEWLFRLAVEPRRLCKHYLLGNVEFMILIFRQLLKPGTNPEWSSVAGRR